MEVKDILSKIGYVRNLARLSARELSLRIGMSPQYVAQVERGRIVLTMDKFLKILDVCNYPIDKFFYESPETYEMDKEVMGLFSHLSPERKEGLINLLR